MTLWDLVINVLEPCTPSTTADARVTKNALLPKEHQMLLGTDYVPPNVSLLSDRCKFVIMEDNDAVIKMCMKVRAPRMRHVARTHRVDVDSLLERIHGDTHICIKYINTKLQIADIFTKGSFSAQTWNSLCRLLQVGPIGDAKVV